MPKTYQELCDEFASGIRGMQFKALEPIPEGANVRVNVETGNVWIDGRVFITIDPTPLQKEIQEKVQGLCRDNLENLRKRAKEDTDNDNQKEGPDTTKSTGNVPGSVV